MSVITVTRFTVDPSNAAALRDAHAALVTAMKQADTGLLETWLGRIGEAEWAAVWRWDRAASLQAARENLPAPELAQAAFALAGPPAVDEIHVVDER
jgi:quinol monooxygenase YgiN